MYSSIYNQLAKNLSPSRLKHSVGVSRTAEEMAQRFGEDSEKAKIAGLLHDCAREFPKKQLLQLAQEFAIVRHEVELCQPILLHAAVGAAIACKDYGISDKDILQAITMHTTGGAAMSKLDIIIYIADYIEPGREYPEVERLREKAKYDLSQTFLGCLNQSILHIIRKGNLIHPGTISDRNEVLMYK